MNTVYIVDDEGIVLDGLVHWVDWKKIDVKVLGTATSGTTALNDILYLKPDVVITDIRMPGKDGLELIEEVQKTLPQTEFIVLSGYNEFAYAQRAIHYGVKEYLLKPVEEEKVLQVVEKALLERKSLGRKAMYPNNLSSVRSLELFQKLLNPNRDETEGLLPVISAVCDAAGHTADMEAIAQKLEVLHLEEKDIYYSRNDTEFIMLFLDPDHVDINGVIGMVSDIMEQIFMEPVFFGICRRELADCSYYRAYLHSRQSGLEAKFYCIPQLELMQISNEWKEDPFDKEELFHILCSEADYEKSTEQFAAAYENARRLKVKTRLLKREAVAMVQFLANAFLDRYDTVAVPGKQFQEMIHMIEDAESYIQLKAVMADILKKVKDSYAEWCQDYENQAIERIKQFINSNINQPLDIAMIADYAHMSQNYVSSYFKKHTGAVLSDYILKMKMERAIQLLSKSALKINHIAAEVGFSDPKYFCKVFKKYTGITASDFRKKR